MIKEILKKIVFGKKYDSETYKNYLIKKGMRIGKGTRFFYPRDIIIDETRPWLIEIGENVQITKNVSILTHGYDWSVLKGKYGEILGSSGKVKIGDNVFIGFNTTILKGVTIGNNVIIGVGSVVTKDIPDNSVIAGVPAKVIMTIDEYYEKRKRVQYQEAKELVLEYKNVYNKFPEEDVLREFYYLFKEREEKSFSDENFVDIMKLVNNYEYSLKKFMKTDAAFKSYSDFIDTIKKELNTSV